MLPAPCAQDGTIWLNIYAIAGVNASYLGKLRILWGDNMILWLPNSYDKMSPVQLIKVMQWLMQQPMKTIKTYFMDDYRVYFESNGSSVSLDELCNSKCGSTENLLYVLTKCLLIPRTSVSSGPPRTWSQRLWLRISNNYIDRDKINKYINNNT